MKKLFTNENLEDIFKKNKLAFVCAFSIGVLISTIPYINKLIEDLKVERLIEKERQMIFKEKEKKCKGINSSYNKYLNLGFPKTAISKFNICMNEK